MTTRSYYYGDGTAHIVQLTEDQANAILKIRITEVIEDPITNEVWVKTNLSEEEALRYSEAADILNEYLESHTVLQEDLEKPVLRPVD